MSKVFGTSRNVLSLIRTAIICTLIRHRHRHRHRRVERRQSYAIVGRPSARRLHTFRLPPTHRSDIIWPTSHARDEETWRKWPITGTRIVINRIACPCKKDHYVGCVRSQSSYTLRPPSVGWSTFVAAAITLSPGENRPRIRSGRVQSRAVTV